MSDVNLRKYIPAVILVILLGIAFLVAGQRGEKQEPGIVFNTGQEKETGTVIKETKSGEDETVKSVSLVKVYVCGSVNVPDVYELPAGSRIKDAVEMAGGFTVDAVGEVLNLAGYIEDGQRIYVPCAGDLESGGGLQEESSVSGRVNINKAGMDELMTLPGIGEAKAKSIIKYRETHGDFKSVEALKNVGGIKEGVYASLCDLITVD